MIDKALMKEWAEPVNNLYLEETYGREFINDYGFWKDIKS